MLKYVCKKILYLIPVLFIISIVSFSLLHFGTRDYVDALSEQTGMFISETSQAEMRSRIGLDASVHEQYISWLQGVFHGDMGNSFVTSQPVLDTFFTRLPATLLLTIVSVLVSIVLAIPIGMYSAIHKGKWVDCLIRCISFVTGAMPSFLLAFLLLYLFVVKLHILPITNTGSWRGYILPLLSLIIPMTFKWIRQIRVATLTEMNKEYVSFLHDKGISQNVIYYKYVLRSLMNTILTMIGISMGSLLGGTVVIENIFSIEGVGKMAIQAVVMRDYPVIQVYVLWMVSLYTVVHVIIDSMYCYMNPKVRLISEENT